MARMPKTRRFRPTLTLLALLAAIFSARSFAPRTWQCDHTFYGHAIYRGTVSNQVVLLEVPGRTEWVRAPIHSLSEEDRRWVQANDPIHIPEQFTWNLPEWLKRGLVLGFLLSLLLHVLILAPLLPPPAPEPVFSRYFRPKKRQRRGNPAIFTVPLSLFCVIIAAHWTNTGQRNTGDQAALVVLATMFPCQFAVIWLGTRLDQTRAFLLTSTLIAVTAASILAASLILDPSRHSIGGRHMATHLSVPPGSKPAEPHDAPLARGFSSAGKRSVTIRRAR